MVFFSHGNIDHKNLKKKKWLMETRSWSPAFTVIYQKPSCPYQTKIHGCHLSTIKINKAVIRKDTIFNIILKDNFKVKVSKEDTFFFHDM